MNNNFTFSKEWIDAFILRYSPNEIINFDNIYFYKQNHILKCQHFFNFNLSKKSLKKLSDEINNGNIIRFNYIDNLKLFDQLSVYFNQSTFKVNVIDSWDAPRLVLESSVNKYLKYNKNQQIRRNYKKYIEKKNQFTYKSSNDSNILDLWTDVLNIDFNSWKRQENSDMKSLEREDLQYLLFLMKNSQNINLNVIYYKEVPLAYSLMFKNNSDDFWYAVKWGASFEGRKYYAGIFCLFNHLEKLYLKEKKLHIDFWGRRNNTYDLLKNTSIVRNHIEISKKV